MDAENDQDKNPLCFVTPPRSESGPPPRESTLVKAPRAKKRLPEGSYRESDKNFGSCSFMIQWQNFMEGGTISLDISRQDSKSMRKPLRSLKTISNIKRRLFSSTAIALSPDEGVYSGDEEISVFDEPIRKKKLVKANEFTPLSMTDRLEPYVGTVKKPNPNRPNLSRPKVLLSANRSTGKTCASCGTKKTPLWRDSEDGIPYCNACGIRYRKYKTSCGVCRYVPRKEACTTGQCSRCGGALISC